MSLCHSWSICISSVQPQHWFNTLGRKREGAPVRIFAVNTGKGDEALRHLSAQTMAQQSQKDVWCAFLIVI